LLEEPSQPVVWRGPVISGVVKQFYTDVLWGELDVLFIDMPPGTGDVPLTVFQSLKIDGIVVVTTPQDLVSLIVEKSVKMAEIMNVPVIGLVENMSYFRCPDCDKKLYVFGKSKTEEVAKEHGTRKLLEIPIDENIRTLVDDGNVEGVDVNFVNDAINKIMEN
ncbi:MAG: P-loop NTPase, partial [Clostridia bacterium]|nr:P-loop NTPase [Clostridia bacterium]